MHIKMETSTLDSGVKILFLPAPTSSKMGTAFRGLSKGANKVRAFTATLMAMSMRETGRTISKMVTDA